uniref:EF-hand domain-containing protein n=1 Tax=Vitrella brassicaformis TaxID=1169539 RepID=A0A7S1P9G9_9ALVE|mmetsp:Transcript_47925/g.119903  ORF Transcript_47925/g.119903 Transcript_47925/m.119903 type:complete len:704 (+) Transcript_47925:56-2167(+)
MDVPENPPGQQESTNEDTDRIQPANADQDAPAMAAKEPFLYSRAGEYQQQEVEGGARVVQLGEEDAAPASGSGAAQVFDMYANGEDKFNLALKDVFLDADTTGARCLTSQQFKDFFNKKVAGFTSDKLEKFYQLMHIKDAEQPEGAAAAATAAGAGASGDGVDFEEFLNFFAPPEDSNGNNPVLSVFDNIHTLKEEMDKFVAQSQSILSTTGAPGATGTATEAQKDQEKDQEGQEGGNKEIIEDGDQQQQQVEEGQGHGEGEGEGGDSSGGGTVAAAAGGEGTEGGEGGADVGDGEEGNEAEGERGDPAMILRKKLFLQRVYALMMIEWFEDAVTQLRGVNFDLTNHTRKIEGFDELPPYHTTRVRDDFVRQKALMDTLKKAGLTEQDILQVQRVTADFGNCVEKATRDIVENKKVTSGVPYGMPMARHFEAFLPPPPMGMGGMAPKLPIGIASYAPPMAKNAPVNIYGTTRAQIRFGGMVGGPGGGMLPPGPHSFVPPQHTRIRPPFIPGTANMGVGYRPDHRVSFIPQPTVPPLHMTTNRNFTQVPATTAGQQLIHPNQTTGTGQQQQQHGGGLGMGMGMGMPQMGPMGPMGGGQGMPAQVPYGTRSVIQPYNIGPQNNIGGFFGGPKGGAPLPRPPGPFNMKMHAHLTPAPTPGGPTGTMNLRPPAGRLNAAPQVPPQGLGRGAARPPPFTHINPHIRMQ